MRTTRIHQTLTLAGIASAGKLNHTCGVLPFELLVATLGNLNWGKRACAVLVLCSATASALPAQTFTTLFSFDGTDGRLLVAGLVQAANGDLYGTTDAGGGSDQGTVFKITPGGTLTTLYSFCSQSGCTDGNAPYAGVVQGTDGNLYGTTQGGGASGQGTVFKITPSGTLTTLHSFCSEIGCTDGQYPYGSLVQAANGDLYGATGYGGANCSFPCGGTIFKIAPDGALTTLYSFCAQGGTTCTDGSLPIGGLVQAADGDLYGVTDGGGANNGGTVFKITPSGTLTTLHNFCSQGGSLCTDGTSANPLVQASNGDFYGTTYFGGPNETSNGIVFKITPTGAFTTLYSFCSLTNCTDGTSPTAGLVQGTDGNLYGTTLGGGTTYSGTIFKITPGGALTTLYSFCPQGGSDCTDALAPQAGLVQDTNGELYGAAGGGTFGNYGTIFRLSVGLGPFVETQTTSGEVGEGVKILGTDLTGAASVSFNGTATVFEVVSPSLIETKVPTGATSGRVSVVTHRGTLTSNVRFRVLP